MIGKKSIIDRRAGEEVIIHLRRHWFVVFKVAVLYLFLFLLPLLIYAYLYFVIPELLGSEMIVAVLAILLFSYYLCLLVLGFTVWTDNYLDVWTVTNRRVISREQKGLFHRVTSELELWRIQDITHEEKGFWRTVLNYGDVYIQTAGETGRFVFDDVPRPQQVARIIEKINEDSKKNKIDAGAI